MMDLLIHLLYTLSRIDVGAPSGSRSSVTPVASAADTFARRIVRGRARHSEKGLDASRESAREQFGELTGGRPAGNDLFDRGRHGRIEPTERLGLFGPMLHR